MRVIFMRARPGVGPSASVSMPRSVQDPGLRSSVTVSVVEAAGRSAVVLGGEAARRVGLDVVDLTVGGGDVTEGVEALPVPDLHGTAGWAGGQAAAPAAVEDPRRTAHNNTFHP